MIKNGQVIALCLFIQSDISITPCFKKITKKCSFFGYRELHCRVHEVSAILVSLAIDIMKQKLSLQRMIHHSYC